jgi:hypothetical protein
MKSENQGVQNLLSTKPSEGFVMAGLEIYWLEKKILGYIGMPWGLKIKSRK